MKRYTEGELLKALREWVCRKKTQAEAARHLGISHPYLTDMLGERRPISRNVAGSLGFVELERAFVRKGEAA